MANEPDPSDEGSLEGWEPVVGAETTLDHVIERAFDYRGDVTVVRRDGTELVGYLFNRNAEVREPFVQMFDRAGDGPIAIPYAEIRTIRFTGRDPAAGNSWKAWVERKEKEKALWGAASSADRLDRDPGSHGG